MLSCPLLRNWCQDQFWPSRWATCRSCPTELLWYSLHRLKHQTMSPINRIVLRFKLQYWSCPCSNLDSLRVQLVEHHRWYWYWRQPNYWICRSARSTYHSNLPQNFLDYLLLHYIQLEHRLYQRIQLRSIDRRVYLSLEPHHMGNLHWEPLESSHPI